MKGHIKSSNTIRLQLAIKSKPLHPHSDLYYSINNSFAAKNSRNEKGQHKGTLTQEGDREKHKVIILDTKVPSVPKSRESSTITDSKKLVNESFSCKDLNGREQRSHSQFGKLCKKVLELKNGVRNTSSQANTSSKLIAYSTFNSNKENANKSNKIVIRIHADKNLPSKRLVIAENEKFVNNANTSSVKYDSQLESTKKIDFSQANNTPLESASYRKDPQCVEVGLRLEKKLRKYKGNNKLNMCSSCFDEIIKVDPYFGKVLKEIKNEYEFTITELSNKEVPMSNFKESAILLKELKRQALYIEKLKEKIKELSKKKVLVKSSSTRQEVRRKIVIPKLDLSKIHSYNEDISSKELHTKDVTSGKNEISLMDYQDEFMAMEDAFSQSWKDALANERRYK